MEVSTVINDYIPTIGLEIHIQLALSTKMFAPEGVSFGAIPNTQVSPISLAHPGTLPTINKKAIDYAICLGLACKSNIEHVNFFARKNYFYPDLPKGYQITQSNTPICSGGSIMYYCQDQECSVDLIRIHMEEDAGKSLYNIAPHSTYLDYNRAGVALLEMVTCPCIKSSQHAYDFLYELRRIVRYLGISDGDMEKGSMRCDINISVAHQKATTLGQRVEIKNLNSIHNVKSAIEYEIQRQIDILNNGGVVEQETRMFDAESGTTKFQRKKESTTDYKYFIEPDLPPVIVTDEWIKSIEKQMPLLPNDYKKKLINDYKLSNYVADILIEDKQLLIFYENLVNEGVDYVTAANWLLGPVKGYINEYKIDLKELPLSVQILKALITMVNDGVVSYTVATQELFIELTKDPMDPHILAERLNLIQTTDTDYIRTLINEVIKMYPNKVLEYKNGKTGILMMFVGEVMKRSKGKADPHIVNDILKELLD